MPTTFNIEWDAAGERFYETGTDRGVLYRVDAQGAYSSGVAWNGLTGVTESPSGADSTDFWADNIKYASVRAAETFGCTIEAYTYPEEFEECDGSVELATGIVIGQQVRKPFGFSYRTKIGSDATPATEDGRNYKIHLIYGCTASPSDRGYTTINDSPDAITFSWEVETTPVNVTGHKPTACLTIDASKVAEAKVTALENVLYGSGQTAPRLPLPDEVLTLVA